MNLSFDGKLAVVTGGASGIGLACAQALHAAGARVRILDVNDKADLPSGLEGKVHFADLCQPQTVVDAFDQVIASEGAAPDVLVNSAGAVFPARFLDMDIETWRRTIDLNLTGSFVAAQTCARHMSVSGRGGALVMISSMAGYSGISTRAAYAAAKAGVINLVRSMAVELAEYGIRANAVAPGAITTPLTEVVHRGANAPLLEGIMKRTPLARYGHSDEVANAVLFLAHSASSYVNGETLLVDGGFTNAGVRF